MPKTLLVSELFLPEEGGSIRWFANVLKYYPPGQAIVLTRAVPDSPARERIGPIQVYRRRLPWHDRLKPFDFMEIGPLFCVNAAALAKRHACKNVQCARVFPEGLAGLYCRQRLGLPYVVYVHGEEVARYRNYRIEKQLLPIIFSRASAVIANSANSARLASQCGALAGRIKVVHPGVDIDQFHPDVSPELARRAFGLGGRRVILTVGRLTPRKGQDLVIDAMPHLLARVPDLVYLVVGRGEDDRRLRDLAQRRRLADRVIFAGRVDEALLASCYAAADVLVMPNRQLADGDLEGFGLVFLEAAACGKPAVAGRSGGAGEAVVDGVTGILVNPERPDSLREAIVRLLADPGLARQMGLAGRQRVQAEFAWPRVADRIRSIVSELSLS